MKRSELKMLIKEVVSVLEGFEDNSGAIMDGIRRLFETGGTTVDDVDIDDVVYGVIKDPSEQALEYGSQCARDIAEEYGYYYDDDNAQFFKMNSNAEPREDHFNSDAEADADTLSSAGWGSDEDYGGGDDRF
jgi:hypothetical protein